MSDALLDRLVAEGVLSRADAARAAARQEKAGGAVDTALLELRLVPPARLAGLLARVTGIPAAPEAAFASPDPRARRVFPAKVAERHGIAPFALDGRELSVATTYPPDVGLVEEIGVMLSLRLRPHVAPEWRVRSLVHALYGTPLPERLATLAAAPEREAPAAQPAPPAAEPRPAAAPPVPAPAPQPPGPPGWSAEAARAALAAATTRDDAIRVALRHARDFFAFAAVLSVRRDGLVGHDALGIDPVARDACRRVVVGLSDPGLFGTPLTTRAPYLGPPPSDPVTASVLSGLGRGMPHTVLVVPVYVQGRAACVLYADNDDAPVAASRLGSLFVLMGSLGGVLERLIRERKSAAPATAAPGREEAVEVRAAPSVAAAVPATVEAPRAASPEPTQPEPTPAAGPTPAVEATRFAEPSAGPELPEGDVVEDAGPPAPVPAREAVEDLWRVSEPARMEERPLPFSVDVDLGEYEVAAAGEALATGRAADLAGAVDELLASVPGTPDHAGALARLVAGGAEAAAVLVARLPGPAAEPEAAAGASWPPAEARGPLFAAVAALGLQATKPLLGAVEAADPARRAAVVPLLGRLGGGAALAAIAARAFDADDRVAAEAREALRASAGSPAMEPVVAGLRRALGTGLPAKAVPAARALARLGDADAVPMLIQLLDAGGELEGAAVEALEQITLQRLGADPLRWIAWWRDWRAAPRSSWLLEALRSPDRDVRLRASTELRRAGEPPVTYVVDAPAAERDHAAGAWAAWWREEGLAL